ncbi:MAG: hypothetical protein WCA76_05365 [Candidatus Sulfotelmatobacter sp.]|jgi:hypothetical protein
MSADARKGYGSTLILMILGVLALYGGARWVGFLVPAAIIVWLAASTRWHARRATIDARVDNGRVRR